MREVSSSANYHSIVPKVRVNCNYTCSTWPKALIKSKESLIIVLEVAVKRQQTRRTLHWVPVKCKQTHYTVP